MWLFEGSIASYHPNWDLLNRTALARWSLKLANLILGHVQAFFGKTENTLWNFGLLHFPVSISPSHPYVWDWLKTKRNWMSHPASTPGSLPIVNDGGGAYPRNTLWKGIMSHHKQEHSNNSKPPTFNHQLSTTYSPKSFAILDPQTSTITKPQPPVLHPGKFKPGRSIDGHSATGSKHLTLPSAGWMSPMTGAGEENAAWSGLGGTEGSWSTKPTWDSVWHKFHTAIRLDLNCEIRPILDLYFPTI